MHHYRQALLRMRQGESDREIAAARLMGRRKTSQWRELASARGWLDVQQPLPDDETIAIALGEPRRASTTISTLEPHRALLSAWVEQGVSGAAIHAALKRQHAWAGSYSAVRRLLADIRAHLPPETTCRLDFEPGEAAQVDFGAGPTLIHPDGQPVARFPHWSTSKPRFGQRTTTYNSYKWQLYWMPPLTQPLQIGA